VQTGGCKAVDKCRIQATRGAFSAAIIYRSDAHSRFKGGQLIMARSDKASKSPAAAKTSRPVTLKHLAATLAEEHDLTKRAGEAFLVGLVGLITKHLKKGERIRMSGLGILQVRKRAARMGRNPATGEAIKIKASKKVAFRAAKDLKMAV
jgi:DNA-binding protein HU-beta